MTYEVGDNIIQRKNIKYEAGKSLLLAIFHDRYKDGCQLITFLPQGIKPLLFDNSALGMQFKPIGGLFQFF